MKNVTKCDNERIFVAFSHVVIICHHSVIIAGFPAIIVTLERSSEIAENRGSIDVLTVIIINGDFTKQLKITSKNYNIHRERKNPVNIQCDRFYLIYVKISSFCT